jgi:hypothetical protein
MLPRSAGFPEQEAVGIVGARLAAHVHAGETAGALSRSRRHMAAVDVHIDDQVRVVNGTGIARPDLDRFHPARARRFEWQREVPVLVRPAGR